MIFIDQERVQIPSGWQPRADAAEEQLTAAPDPAVRRGIYEANRLLWTELAPELGRLSGRKCWYCEMRQIRSDMPVDHYRPKGRPSEAANHPGYWWLAFRLANFRYSCTYCNSRRVDKSDGTSGGKQSNFPLVNEGDRASGPADPLASEHPMLLDPTVTVDPGLLFFDLEGQSIPHPRLCAEGSIACARATRSIELLHLNHSGVRDERKKVNRNLSRAFQRALDSADGYEKGDTGSLVAFRTALDDLSRAISAEAELSATARAYLKGRRGDGERAERLLDHLGL